MTKPTKPETKLYISLAMILSYFFVEIVVGYLSSSIALIADSFHMISDFLALIVALYAINLSKRIKRGPSQTYGFQRAEILGALVNGVFLLALCFTLLIAAIQRFVQPEEITNPRLVLIVGAVGLVINIIGMVFFHESHGHHHHHHNHEQLVPVHSHNHSPTPTIIDIEPPHTQPITHQQSLNIHGVFLHFLGDALGSVAVIISALFNLYLPPAVPSNTWVLYIDPFVSLFITAVLIGSAYPLVSRTLGILGQNAPRGVDVEGVRREILKVEGVKSLHEFHVWELSEGKSVASVHVCLSYPPPFILTKEGDEEVEPLIIDEDGFRGHFRRVVEDIQGVLHKRDIHNCTVQPEFEKDEGNDCAGKCAEEGCRSRVCC